MAYYKVRMDVQITQWSEIEAIVKAKDINKAVKKAKKYDFADYEIVETYDWQITQHDELEGISVEEIIGE